MAEQAAGPPAPAATTEVEAPIVDIQLPVVSVVVPVHNYARFLPAALDSALTQDYPDDRYEVVVIDDGSTDDSASVAQRYVDQYPGRVRLVRQENRGYVRTVNRGIAETSGELVALLDADDAWLPGKLRRQVELLLVKPELGLVYADLIPVDAQGIAFERESMLSWVVQRGPLPYRSAARILWTNEALESTILVRREVLEEIPEDLNIADWWIVLQAALTSEIDWIREPLALYRIHGANMSSGQHGGVGTAAQSSVFLADIVWKLRAMRRLDMSVFSPAELMFIWSGVERSAAEALQAAQTYYVELTSTVELDQERAVELLEEANRAHERHDYDDATRLALEALLWDPYLPGARTRMAGSASAFDK